MRTRKYLLLTAFAALAAAVAVTTPWAHQAPGAHGRAQVIVIDGDGDRREWTWESGDDAGWLGVTLERHREPRGARVTGVIDDSPAAEAGLERGDVILAVDGEAVDGPGDLSRRIRALAPGDRVELEIDRDGRAERLVAELGEMRMPYAFFGHGPHGPLAFGLDGEELSEHLRELEDKLSEMNLDIRIPEIDLDVAMPEFNFRIGGFHRPILGVQTVETTPELREHLGAPRNAGLLIGKVREGMPAEEAGLQVGDLIVALDGEEIEHRGDLVRALRDRAGETVELEIVRDGSSFTVDVALPERDDEEGLGVPSHHRLRHPAPPGQRA